MRVRRSQRSAFRAWRRTRPFWGGLLLLLAGLELLGLPLSGILSRGAVRLVVYIAIGGVFGVLIGILLITAGIAVWANPAHRVFYGVAGVVLGVASFPASNLGGFFVCMLLAIVGGSIAFAWMPAGAAAAGGATAGAPAVAEAPAIGEVRTIAEAAAIAEAQTVAEAPASLAPAGPAAEPLVSGLRDSGLRDSAQRDAGQRDSAQQEARP